MAVNLDPTLPLPSPDAQGRIVITSKPESWLKLAGKEMVLAVVTFTPLVFRSAFGGAEIVGTAVTIIGVLVMIAGAGGALLSHVRPGYLALSPEGLSKGGGWKSPQFMPWADLQEIKLSSIFVPGVRDQPAHMTTRFSLLGPKRLWHLPNYGVAPAALVASLRAYHAQACPGAVLDVFDETIPATDQAEAETNQARHA